MFRLLLFSLFVPYFFFSQVTPKLVEELKMDIQSASTFDVDALGNLYVGNFQFFVLVRLVKFLVCKSLWGKIIF
jgi:hypothetical protein